MRAVLLAALGMILSLLAGCQWVQPEARPQTFAITAFAWLPGSDGIVAAKDVAGERRLWLVGTTGTRVRKLTGGDTAEFDPAVSPDGRIIVYVGISAQNDRFLTLFNRTTNTTTPLNIDLAGSHPSAPIFSRDGRFLAVERVYGAADAHSDIYQDVVIYDLRAMRPLGVVSRGDTNRLLGFGSESDKMYMWSTFNNYNHSWNFRYDLWEVDLATLAAHRLSEGGPVRNASVGHMSPSVPSIVFHTWQAEDINLSIVPVPRDIYLAHFSPYRQAQILTGGRASSPRFSPDGTHIVYLQGGSDQSMGLEVCVIGSDGKNPRRLTASGAPKMAPQWSPDGRRIAFIQVEGEGSHALYTIQADGKGLRRIAP